MSKSSRWLAALPVYNEVDYVDDVLNEVVRYAATVLVVDDGSGDGTAERLSGEKMFLSVVTRKIVATPPLKTAFDFAIAEGFEGV